MKRRTLTLLSASLLGFAGTGSSAEIEVMTQNQYLGADIAPLIGAIASGDQAAFNTALLTALRQIADNRSQERFAALAALITQRQPHLVGLQEVWEFKCLPAAAQLPGLPPGYPCSDPEIAGAFDDHLAGTLAALGARYQNAGYVQNFAVQSFTLPDPIGVVPGIPFELNGVPAFLQVQDRDVILVRSDVAVTPVDPVDDLQCTNPSEDGCNFEVALPIGPLGSVERGFLAVDVTVDGEDYRFFNSHLEVQGNSVIPGAIQTAQAAELIATALTTTPAGRQLIIVGDMNSSPNDPAYGPSVPTPYMLFADAGFYDAWALRPGATAGMSCCQQEDLSNKVSLLNQRIDLILTREMPRTVKDVRLLGEVASDRTRPPGGGLWPSDHASVAARLQF